MTLDPYCSAHDALGALAKGECTAHSLLERSLSAASQYARLGGLIHQAQTAAQVAAERGVPAPHQKLALQGLPIVVKDNIDVAGMPTTAGSPALHGHTPRSSATAAARLMQAGAVVIGKANLHELSLGITTNNAGFGPARNPHDPQRIAGGSSGGTAVAVASGMVSAGLGSDTGGSLRIPAALCGVVGFRPSTGRWPGDGVVKISWTRDTVGPIARTVEDCALLDAVVCQEPLHLAPAPLHGVRIGVPRRFFWDGLDPSVDHAAQAALKALSAAGAVLVDCNVVMDINACNHAGMVIALHELLPSLGQYLSGHGLAFDAAQIGQKIASPDVKGIYASLLGPDAPPLAAYEQALNIDRPRFQQAYAQCFAQHRLEALIFPTTPLPAARIGEDDTVQLLGQTVPTFPTFTRNVGPGSIVGLPGISMPMGVNAAGLPLAIALDGPRGSDRRLLSIAAAVQAVLPTMPRPKWRPGMAI
jgi:indoleacetamide hydrolase